MSDTRAKSRRDRAGALASSNMAFESPSIYDGLGNRYSAAPFAVHSSHDVFGNRVNAVPMMAVSMACPAYQACPMQQMGSVMSPCYSNQGGLIGYAGVGYSAPIPAQAPAPFQMQQYAPAYMPQNKTRSAQIAPGIFLYS